MKLQPTILLTFDVEEFDLPLEYNQQISFQDQLQISKRGFDEIIEVITRQNVAATLFTTAIFALEYSDTIKRLSQVHEIASHTFSHTSFEQADLLKSRLALEGITGKPVTGLRMPRMKVIEMDWVKLAGYQYDSSINPTYIPGRYNNRHLSRTFYWEEEMLRLPISVSPNLRIPLFWLSFKNFPYPLFKNLAMQTLKRDGYLSLYFHSWEFTTINQPGLPKYLFKNGGENLTRRLDKLITDLKQDAVFETIQSYINLRQEFANK